MRVEYVIYDGRATPEAGTDDAQVLSCAPSLEQARRDARECNFGACCIWAYDIDESTDPHEGINERFVETA